jgi:hypothetical protein
MTSSIYLVQHNRTQGENKALLKYPKAEYSHLLPTTNLRQLEQWSDRDWMQW